MDDRKAVVLLSGGLDSSTTLAIAIAEGYKPYALSFRYGQRHAAELAAAKRVAESLGAVKHQIISIDLSAFGGSALTAEIPVPKKRSEEDMSDGIPVTYVPARNTVFLSFALAWAETLRASDIFIGVNAVDYSGYPDCRPEYIEAFTSMARLATRAGVEGKQNLRIHTPLISMSKREIIQRGLELGVDFSQTITCYEPSRDGRACGECDACILRLQGFEANGLPDPAPYVRAIA